MLWTWMQEVLTELTMKKFTRVALALTFCVFSGLADIAFRICSDYLDISHIKFKIMWMGLWISLAILFIIKSRALMGHNRGTKD